MTAQIPTMSRPFSISLPTRHAGSVNKLQKTALKLTSRCIWMFRAGLRIRNWSISNSILMIIRFRQCKGKAMYLWWNHQTEEQSYMPWHGVSETRPEKECAITKSPFCTASRKRSEERRVGKECRCRGAPEQHK